MSKLLRILLFSTIAATTCMALTEMPKPGESRRMRRGPEDNWPAIYPATFRVYGGVYPQHSNGDYSIEGTYNDRPLYRGGSSNWAIYYREGGFWALDFNDVSEDWDGTVATQTTLFGKSEV